MLGALLLRVQAVWHRIPQGPEAQSFLVGDEIAYEELADAVLHGSFFPSPVRVPSHSRRPQRESRSLPTSPPLAVRIIGMFECGKPRRAEEPKDEPIV